MATKDFGQVPAASKLAPQQFRVDVPEDDIKLMRDILQISPIGPAVWENTSENQGPTHMSNPARKYGMRRDWLIHAKDYWLHEFDWRQVEARINALPNFTVDLVGEDKVPFTIHFAALFSKRSDAIPIAFYHGWPGSFLEFLQILEILQTRYTPETLPYHVIVPSLPGYAFSSGPPEDVDYSVASASQLLHTLMIGLGFDSYVSQGGDIGSSVARQQAARFTECKSMHLNMTSLPPSIDRTKEDATMSALEAQAIHRGTEFRESGWAYGIEHGTRTATIGLALSASPLALLSWIGEKFLEWTDEDPALDEILASVSLYWLTKTFPRCIYPYRGLGKPPLQVEKPFGFSFFPKEIHPTPEAWVKQTGNLQHYYSHEKGGHFAAMENPKMLLADVEDWISKVWTS